MKDKTTPVFSSLVIGHSDIGHFASRGLEVAVLELVSR
jgi:hypothetical protein